MNKSEIEELFSRRVSEWLDGELKCGKSCYKDVGTNLGWCVKDVERLKKKGISAGVVRYLGKIAVFRLLEGETPEDVSIKLEIADSTDIT